MNVGNLDRFNYRGTGIADASSQILRERDYVDIKVFATNLRGSYRIWTCFKDWDRMFRRGLQKQTGWMKLRHLTDLCECSGGYSPSQIQDHCCSKRQQKQKTTEAKYAAKRQGG